MKESNRREEFEKLFEGVDENEKRLVDKLIAECVWYEEQMDELKELPFISVNPKNPAQQKTTAAARLYKEYATSYMNALRILLNILRKVESSEADALANMLAEFE